MIVGYPTAMLSEGKLKGAIEMKSGILAVITLIVSGSLLAQSAAVSQITGTVRDSTGSVVAGANVTVTQTDTGFVRTGETEADGAYRLPSLPIGPSTGSEEGRLQHVRSVRHRSASKHESHY